MSLCIVAFLSGFVGAIAALCVLILVLYLACERPWRNRK